MKKIFTLALSLSMMFTAVACSTGTKTSTTAASSEPSKTATTAPSTAPSKDPVKLRVAWWGGQARHDYTLKVIELYEKQHPNVKIEAEYAPFDDYSEKACASGFCKPITRCYPDGYLISFAVWWEKSVGRSNAIYETWPSRCLFDQP